jgi:hypothetical protein
MLKHIPFYASLLDKQLTEKVKATHRHVLLYGAIEAHSYGRLGCIAGNELLAQETGLSVENIRRYVGEIKAGGWVNYTIGRDNSRSEIIPLLEIEVPQKLHKPCVNNTQAPRQKLHKPCVEITHIGNNIGNNKVTDIKATATPVALKATKIKSKPTKPKALTVEDPSVNNIIELFKVVDINYTVLYARKTERTAVETLLKLHSPQEIADVLNKAVIYNKLPYVTSYDKIYKPTDLLRNWQKLHDKEAEIALKPKMVQKEANDRAKNRVVW